MKATNIEWNIDSEEILEKVDETSVDNMVKFLGLPATTYSNMTTSERHDYVLDFFHHSPGSKSDFMDLPNEITLPKELVDEEDVSDWLSDEYGFCHNGFQLLREECDPIKCKIFFSAEGSDYDIEQMYSNLNSEYPEFEGEEVYWNQEPSSTYEDEEGSIQLFDFSVMWEGIWTGSEEELGKLIHHAEGLYGNTEINGSHCEVCINNTWHGGDDHKVTEN